MSWKTKCFSLSAGLAIAWVFCTFGLTALAGGSAFQTGDNSPWVPYATAAAALSAFAYASRSFSRVLAENPVFSIAAVLAGCVGGLFMGSPFPLVVLTSVIAAALGSTALLASWSRLYASFTPSETEQAALGAVVASACTIIFILWIPDDARYVVAQVLPLASLAALKARRQHHAGNDDNDSDDKEETALPRATGQSANALWQNMIGLGVPTFLLFFLFSFSTLNSEGTAYYLSPATMGLGFLLALFGAFLYFRFNRSLNALATFHAVAPVLAIAALFIGYGLLPRMSTVLLVALMALVPQLAWICFSKTFDGRNPIRHFIGGSLVCQTAVLLAGTSSSLVMRAILNGWVSLALVTACAILALVFAGSAIAFLLEGKLPPSRSDTPLNDTEVVTMLAEQYGLSKREKEILSYLVKGRSTPYIRDALYISSNTVNSHIKRIYAKTGTHTRQEIIDLHEQAKQ